MRVPVHLVPGISQLLRYPGEPTADLASALADAAMATGHPCQEHLEAFALTARSLDLRELQELFTRSFDLSPECSLDVGWHLFGESYQRGQFMAMIRHHLREHGLEEGRNLPDHLPNLLDLGMKLERQDAMDLVDDCILPTLERVLPALKESPYHHVLQALFLIFTVDRVPSEGDRPGHAALCVPSRPPHARPGQSPDQSSPSEAACAE
jgi:nitrate reductase delta subunit